MSYLNRIKSIEYQLIKNMTFTPSDEQLVAMAQSILRAVLIAAENAEPPENVYNAVQTASLPTTLLGVSVDWDESNPEGDSFTLTLNGITVTQDADDAIQEIISGGGTGGSEFIMTVETTSDNEDFILPTGDGTFDYTVDWGDGVVENNQTGSKTHTYSTAGQYDVKISGTFPHMNQGWSGTTPEKIKDIKQWGNQVWGSMNRMFRGATGLTSYSAIDVPDLSSVADLGYMFYGATLPDGFDISDWNTSSATRMDRMFYQAILPTGFDISTWNTSSVTNMYYMFNNVTLPDGFDISGWTTSSVTNMVGMFRDATLPTGFDISGWDTSSVTNMGNMFSSTTLPTGFDISGWDTSSVTNMGNMFSSTTLPTGFDISGWDTSSVMYMQYMFSGATLPDGFDISGWDISSIANMYYMFESVTLSTADYDAILNGWSTLDAGETQIPTDINIDFGNSQYTNETARDTLVNTYGWTITDGGLAA